jgi:hypothetical protein
MSNYLAISTVTSALRNLILAGLQSATYPWSYDVVVTTSPLDQARPSDLEQEGQINLFLYHVGHSAAWRNEPLPRQVKLGETGPPPLALDLRYLVTAYAPDYDGVQTHRVLGCALSLLHAHPVLGSAELAAAVVNSDVHEQIERIRLTPLSLAAEEMSQIWNSFQKPYHVSMAWQASVVLIESKRAAKAPLPVLTRGTPAAGSDDKGISLVPSAGPVMAGIESIVPPAEQESVRLGETLTVNGHLLAADVVRVAIDQSRWTSTKYLVPASVTATAVTATLPSGATAESDWPAGTYLLSLAITKTLGQPEIETDELPFNLAPNILSISPTSATPNAQGIITLTVNVRPLVWVGQRVTLIVGDRTFKPNTFAVKTGALTFVLKGLTAGKYRVRIRVDGVDSIIVNKTTTPPTYVGPELTVT